MNRFKKGLKDVGVDRILGVASVDSDDEEEKESGHEAAEGDESSSSEFAKRRCGAKSVENVFLEEPDETDDATSVKEPCKVNLGLRHCFFDHSASDALAAMIVEAKERYGAEIVVDIRVNPVLEDEMVDALHR
jgi:hypothetical protein